jgi:DNA invertase Pin-like site-specific DNA recombinase
MSELERNQIEERLKAAEARLEEQKEEIDKLKSYIIKDGVMNNKTTNRRF